MPGNTLLTHAGQAPSGVSLHSAEGIPAARCMPHSGLGGDWVGLPMPWVTRAAESPACTGMTT